VSSIVYLKFDGSVLHHYPAAAASCVIYQKDSPLPLRLRKERLRVTKSGEAEQMGFILGVDTLIDSLPLLSKQLGDITLCRIYGDSQVLFRHLRGKTVPKSRTTASLSQIASKGIERLDRLGVKTEMYWVPRKCNVLADLLCRLAYSSSKPIYDKPRYLSYSKPSKTQRQVQEGGITS
jgi:hypothetical protein